LQEALKHIGHFEHHFALLHQLFSVVVAFLSPVRCAWNFHGKHS